MRMVPVRRACSLQEVSQPGRANEDSVGSGRLRVPQGTRRALPGVNKESDLTGTVIRYSPGKTLIDGTGGPEWVMSSENLRSVLLAITGIIASKHL